MELLLFSIPRQKQKQLLRISTALVLTKWEISGCLARLIKFMKRTKSIPVMGIITITKPFEHGKFEYS